MKKQAKSYLVLLAPSKQAAECLKPISNILYHHDTETHNKTVIPLSNTK